MEYRVRRELRGVSADGVTPFPAMLSRVIAAVDRRRLTAVALLLLAVILGLAVLRHTRALRWAGDMEANYCTLVIDQAAASLSAFLKGYEDATFQFVANQDLNRLLLEYVSAADTYEIARYNQAFSNFLEGYTFSRCGAYDAVFLDESNRNRKALTMRGSLPASYLKYFRGSGAYEEIVRADGKSVWVFGEDCARAGMNCVIVGRRIKHLFTEKPLGVVAIMIDADELARVVNDYPHDHFYSPRTLSESACWPGGGTLHGKPTWRRCAGGVQARFGYRLAGVRACVVGRPIR